MRRKYAKAATTVAEERRAKLQKGIEYCDSLLILDRKKRSLEENEQKRYKEEKVRP